jgi:predicted DsbA family dithiol-disulfide isomerase
MVLIELYADLSCPFAYLLHSTWRSIRSDYAGRIQLAHQSLALEYVNREPTPKRTLDAELPVLFADEPEEIAWQAWTAPDSTWPVTIWPAFEAVKAAERQGLDMADDLAWHIRAAFFGKSRCIALRHVLLELAGQTGLALEQFERDFDSGAGKAQVIAEAKRGWEDLQVTGSPSLRGPDGRIEADFGLAEIGVGPNGRPRLLRHGQPDAEREQLPRRALDGWLSGQDVPF